MKNKKALAITLALSMVLTGAIAPAVNAAGLEEAPVGEETVYANATSIEDVTGKLEQIGNIIKRLKEIKDKLTGDQIDNLAKLEKAYNFLKERVGEAYGKFRGRYNARVDLVLASAEAITADATEFVDSEQQAHVIIGFAVTRGLVKAVDLLATEEELLAATEVVYTGIEDARAIPKQTDDSRATHYDKEVLKREIKRAKRLRKKVFKDNMAPEDLVRVDIEIANAERVRRNKKATVAEVEEAVANLTAVVDEAYMNMALAA